MFCESPAGRDQIGKSIHNRGKSHVLARIAPLVNADNSDGIWFHSVQFEWMNQNIATQAGNPATVTSDGVDVYLGQSAYDPRHDTDCDAADGGAWECAAHARYRHTSSANFCFADGHAKSIQKYAMKWFKNIWVTRPNNGNCSDWWLECGGYPY